MWQIEVYASIAFSLLHVMCHHITMRKINAIPTVFAANSTHVLLVLPYCVTAALHMSPLQQLLAISPSWNSLHVGEHTLVTAMSSPVVLLQWHVGVLEQALLVAEQFIKSKPANRGHFL